MKKENNKKKIIIFSGYFYPHIGGIERYVDKLSLDLEKLGFDIVIVTSNETNLPNIEQKDKYKIYRLPIRNLFRSRYPIPIKNKEYKYLIKQIEKEKGDYFIVNTRFHLTSLIGLKLSKKLNVPSLLIEHGSNHFTVNNKILDFFGEIYEHMLTRRVKKYANNFYGVSERCNNWLKHFSIEASGVFYNSIDDYAYDSFKNKKYSRDFKDKTVITFLGRIIREKGIVMLLDAFKELSKKYKNIVLVIGGDGPILEQLKKEYNLDNVYFEGRLVYDEVMALFNVTDIFVHPSMFPEGLPSVILEAGLMKSAVVATDRGGTIEVINDDKYGLICEENTESLKEKLEILLKNPKMVNDLKNNIHDRVKNNFTWEVTAKVVKKELEEIDNEKR